jgi:hypothetical protein
MRPGHLAALFVVWVWFCSLGSLDVGWPTQAARQFPVSARLLHEASAADAPPGSSEAATRRVHVQFPSDRSDVALSGQVHGYDTVEYLVGASPQQRLTVRLTGTSPYLLIGIHGPDGETLCVGACDRQWTGLLAQAGDYTIKVGLVRAEARRRGRASYTLHVSLAR